MQRTKKKIIYPKKPQKDLSKFDLSAYNQSQNHKKAAVIAQIQKGGRQAPILDLYAKFPSQFSFIKETVKRNEYYLIPKPPLLKNKIEKRNLYQIQKLRKKYQFIWVLMADKKHSARKQFQKIYHQENASNLITPVRNMLKPQQVDTLNMLIDGKLDIKLLLDSTAKNVSELFQSKDQVMEIRIEQLDQIDIRPSKKIKLQRSLNDFVKETIKYEVEKTIKNVAYANFIHFNSSPEIFTRRKIAEDSLKIFSQEKTLQLHHRFVDLINEDTEQKYLRAMNAEMRHETSVKNLEKEKGKKKVKMEINKEFEKRFTQFLTKNFPFQNQTPQIRKEISCWILLQYVQESSIYPVLNNTMRKCLNSEKVKPVSTYFKYLFSAINFFFNRHYAYQINKQRKVYRAGRASVKESKQFVEGQYIWNLGFLSTSRSRQQTKIFLEKMKRQSEEEALMMIISVPELNVEQLPNQEGFCFIDKIPQIQKAVLFEEEEILFNPLNLFKIEKWDKEQRELYLSYSPHLQMIQKYEKGLELTREENKLIKSLRKLQTKSYDKGTESLQNGKPGEAVAYFQQAQNNGETLSISQKSIYVQSLNQCGDLFKINEVLEKYVKEEQDALQQMQEQISAEVIQKNLQIVNEYQLVQNYSKAEQRVEKTVSAIRKLTTNQHISLKEVTIQIEAQLKISNLKLATNQIVLSIIQSLRCLKIIDILSHFNYSQNLFQMENQIKKLKISSDYSILNEIKQIKGSHKKSQEQLIKNINLIRNDNFNLQQKESASSSHTKLEEITNNYLQERMNRTFVQKIQYLFIKSYAQIKKIKLQQKQEQLNLIKIIEKKLNDQLSLYSYIFIQEIKTLKTLHSCLIRTTINIKMFLRYYQEYFFPRYEQFLQMNKNQSVDYVNMLRISTELFHQYDCIVKDLPQDKKPSKLLKKAEQILQKIENQQEANHIVEKVEIKQAIAQLFVKQMDEKKLTPKKRQSSSFVQAIESCNKTIEMHRDEKSMNSSFFAIKDQSMKISILNNSKDVKLQESSFLVRLIQGKNSYKDVLIQLQKNENEKKFLEKSMNMGRLKIMMSQNNLKLGIDDECQKLLNQGLEIIQKTLNYDPQSTDLKANEHKSKQYYGNSAVINSMKILMHLKILKGAKEVKYQIERYRVISDFIKSRMNQPLVEAAMLEYLGTLTTNYCFHYSDINIDKALKPLQESIQLRTNLLGQNNFSNAKVRYFLFHIYSKKKNEQLIEKQYERAKKILNNLDAEADPYVIMYDMLLEVVKNEIKGEPQKVIKAYKSGINAFLKHDNKIITLQFLDEMIKAYSYLLKNKDEQGEAMLNKCTQNIKKVQKQFRLKQRIHQKNTHFTFKRTLENHIDNCRKYYMHKKMTDKLKEIEQWAQIYKLKQPKKDIHEEESICSEFSDRM